VLGAGPIAQAAHLESCRRAYNAELAAICDLAEDLLERVAAIHRPRTTYTDYAAMLADPEIDAVIVAVADQFHVEAARQALAAGKHVLVEKPMGVDVEGCRRLQDAAAASGRRLQVGSMKRFDPGIAAARRFIAEEIGELWRSRPGTRTRPTATPRRPTSSRSSRRATAPAAPPGDPKADRRRYYLLGHGSHLVDTAHFLGGPIDAVRATLVEKFGAYCWFVEAAFASGAVGHLDLTVAVRMDWHEGFQVYGEHGSVVGKTFNPWYLRSSEVECFSTRDDSYHRVLGADAHVYRLQVEAFADAILTGAGNEAAGAEDGLAVVRALVAIARSTETGGWVRLDDVEGEP
jgi:predicted dehydrogenase